MTADPASVFRTEWHRALVARRWRIARLVCIALALALLDALVLLGA